MRERRVWRILSCIVYTLRHAIIHCMDDSRDHREGNGVQGDEALEGADGGSVPWTTLQRDIHGGYPQVNLEAQLSTVIHR